jgi:hypothetical protein
MVDQQHHQRHAIPPELEARITEIENFFPPKSLDCGQGISDAA